MDQTQSDWQRREELIDELLGMATDRRKAFIDALAAESPRDAAALRQWLMGIERPLAYLDPAAPAVAVAPGELVGNWRVLNPIGRGGMGEVWLGERADGLFEKKVAIKFIRDDRRGLSDSIESERRLLAGLQHAGIVRLLDAGVSTDGHAFLVTDFVEGTTLDLWLERRQPSLSQRLDLLRQVGEAVAYAHERLVIHRDIKPRNVLVDDTGRAYLLDFGIARALADLTDAPQTTNLILTPEFAAPELIAENVASIRSDIYALGGLLYFLLCGKPPLSVRGLPLLAAIKTIRDESPLHVDATAHRLFPTESRRLLADLDAIALKALAKSPRERYGTVEAFLSDVKAARASLPIQATPPDAWDRTRRYLRRHRFAIAVTTVVAVSLLAGMAGTLWQARRAGLQSARAEAEAARATTAAKNANAVRDFLIEVFGSASPDNSLGKTPTATELLDHGVKRIDAELAGQPELQAQLLDTMGMAYSSMANTDTAVDLFRRARATAIAAAGEDTELAAKITLDFARVVVNRSDDARAYGELAPALERLMKRDPSTVSLALRIGALTEYGALRSSRGDPKQAEDYLRQAVALGRTAAPADQIELAFALDNLHFVLLGRGHLTDSIDVLKEALAIRLRLLGPRHPSIAYSQAVLAPMLSQAGRLDDASELMEKAVETTRMLYGDANAEYSTALSGLAQIRDRQGHFDEAEATALQALAVLKKAGQENGIAAMNRLNLLSIIKAHQKDLDQAIVYVRSALAISTRAYGETEASVLVQRMNLAAFEAMNGEYAAAEPELRTLLELHKKIGSDNVAPPLQWLGYVRRLRGDPAEARMLHTASVASAKALQGENGTHVLKGYAQLAEDERNLDLLDQARANAESAQRGLEKQQNNPNNPDLQDVRYLLAQFDVLQNRCAGSVGELESTWERRKQLKATPMNQWLGAEAGLFLGLCRRQNGSDGARALIADNAKTLRESPLADPFVKRLATAAMDSK